jgi:hypothetical protein
VGVLSLFSNLNWENFEKEAIKLKDESDRDLEELLRQVEKIKELIMLNEKRIRDLSEQKEKARIGQVVLLNLIKELTVCELIDKNKYDYIEQRITQVYSHLHRDVQAVMPVPESDNNMETDTSLTSNNTPTPTTNNTPNPTLNNTPNPTLNEIPPLKEEDNPLTPPIQITIAKSSHPYRKHYRPIYMLKSDDSYWGSPQTGVITTTSITFDFSKRSMVSKFSIRDRGDRQGVKNFTLSFSDEIDGPYSLSLSLMKTKTPFMQSFDVSGVGRFCMVTFITNHGGNVGCKFKVQEVAFN